MKFKVNRKRNKLVAPFNLCKKIPPGNFKKSVFAYGVLVREKIDEKGNVIECDKLLEVIDRDAMGKIRKPPKTAKQKLKFYQKHEEIFPSNDGIIVYYSAIYPAPTLEEILKEMPRTVKMNFVGEFFRFENDVVNGSAVLCPYAVTAAMKLWLKLNVKE